jgi:hypothetical protein
MPQSSNGIHPPQSQLMTAQSLSQQSEPMIFGITIADDDARVVIVVGLKCASLTASKLFFEESIGPHASLSAAQIFKR